MKLKEGPWSENFKNAFLALISSVPLGYLLILYIDDWIFSLVQAFLK